MSSGDFNNLVIRKATAYNPDGSFIKDGYVFTVSSNGKQNWTPDLRLNNIVTSTLALNSELYVASSIFDRVRISTLTASTITTSSLAADTFNAVNSVTCTLTASTLILPSLSFNSIMASSIFTGALTGTTLTGSTIQTTNLTTSNLSFSTLVGSTLTGNMFTVYSTLSGSTFLTTNLTFNSANGYTLMANSLTIQSTILGSTLTVSTLTVQNALTTSTLQGSTLTMNSATVQSTLTVSTVNALNMTYSTFQGSTLSANTAIVNSTLIASTVNASNITYSTLQGSTLGANTIIIQSTLVGSTINAVNITYSTFQGSTFVVNTMILNSTLNGSTLNMINGMYSTLQGSSLNANSVVWNSTLIGSTLNATYVTYSTLQGSTIISNTVAIQSTLTVSTINAINIGYSTLQGSTVGANTAVIQSTLVVSSLFGSTLIVSTVGTSVLNAGAIGFSSMTGSSIGTNYITVASTVTASTVNAVNISYSTLQGNAIQSQSIIASTLTGSTINFTNLSFSTLLASTMTANVMFPLSLIGSTMNVSNLLTVSSNVGIGTTTPNYPLTVSNTTFTSMELNRASTTTNNFYAAGAVYSVTNPSTMFRGEYAYAYGGAKTLATTTQSQAVGYYAIDVANAGIFSTNTVNGPSGATFYVDSTKTYFQNTALGVGTTSPSWLLTVAKDIPFSGMTLNPMDAQLVISGRSNTGTLKIGTYYTNGGPVSFGAALQCSNFSGSVDTPGPLVLNPLGGNVGIGTTNPSALLSINAGSSNTVALSLNSSGTGLGSGIQFVNTTVSTGRTYGIYSGSDSSLHIYDVTAGADRITINSSGVTTYTAGNSSYIKYGPNASSAYLVVGATVDGAGASTAQVITTNGNLHLDAANSTLIYYGFYANSRATPNSHEFYGTTNKYGNLVLNNTTFYKNGTTSGYYMSIPGGSASTSPYLEFFAGGLRRCYFGNATTTDMTLAAENGAKLNFLTAGVTRMVIDTNGNVGIGSVTVYTGSRMTVVSAGTGSDATNWIAANFGGTGANPRVVIGCLNAAATIGAHSSDLSAWADLSIATGGGNVGIGTATPQCKLHIVGTQTATLGTSSWLTKGSGGVTPSAGGTVSTFCVFASGSIWAGDVVGCANIVSFSDQRIKKDIQRVHDVFDLIQKIEVVSYDHIDQRKKTVKVGVVAQQIQPFLPEIIDKATNWIPVPFVSATSHECHENQVTIMVDTSSPELQIGRQIRLYIEYDKTQKEYDTEIIDLTPSSITCKVWESYHTNDDVFVYGVEVDNFLIVDKQQLGLLALAGVQDLHNMVTVHESTIISLQTQNKILLSQNALLQSQLASLLAWAETKGFQAF